MKRFELIFMILKVPLDVVLLVFAAISAYFLRFTDLFTSLKPVLFDITLPQYLETIYPVVALWILIFAILGLYNPDQNRKLLQDITKIVFASAVGLAFVALYLLFTQGIFESRFLIIVSWIFAVTYLIIGRLIFRGFRSLLYRKEIGLRRVVIVGDNNTKKDLVKFLSNRKGLGYLVVAEYDDLSQENKDKILHDKADEIIFTSLGNDEESLVALSFCNYYHIAFKYSADIFSAYSANMVVNPLAGVPIVELRRTQLEGWGRVTKRIFDILMSVLVLIVTSPILFLSSLVIMLETGRPIIYKNKRVGVRGKKFMTLKLRSMYQADSTGVQFGEKGTEAEEKEKELIKQQNSKEGPIYKIKNDPRVTPFGRFIRRWSVDELPQFINVIKGEMSIVGPRPHQPREVEGYDQKYHKVFSIKPGITGLSQISGRSDLSFEDEMKLDAFYIEKWNLLLDIIIFIKTPFILFRKREVE